MTRVLAVAILAILVLAGCHDDGASGWPGGICDQPACWSGG